MPFNQFVPRALTRAGVHAHAPAASGVYGISNAREWIYIGETDNIQDALLTHMRETGTPLREKQPTGFVFEVCDRASRPGRQDCLVTEYGPACNRQGRPEARRR